MTRDEILIAAAQIFSQKGFHAASMQDIAEAVHLQKASLYHHVTSKQDILLELLDSALDLLLSHLNRVLAEPGTPDLKLRRAMRSYLETLAEYRDLSSLLILEHRSLRPDLMESHVPRRDKFERLWRDLINDGRESGIFNCTDPSLTSRALLGVLNWTITWYRPDGPLSAGEIADYFADLFMDGLLICDEIERNGRPSHSSEI